METKNLKTLYFLLLALALAIILYPLIAHAIEKNKVKEEAKLEQLPALSTPSIEVAEPEKEIEKPLPVPEPKKIPDGKGSTVIKNRGIASYYDYGLKDAPNYSREVATAASRDYPRGSLLLVTNVKTGESVVVRVNDYGPEAWTDRVIDLSSFAFSRIANKRDGLAEVTVELLPPNFE